MATNPFSGAPTSLSATTTTAATTTATTIAAAAAAATTSTTAPDLLNVHEYDTNNNLRNLANALTATVSNDANEREAAEQLLSQLLQHDNNHSIQLLYLATTNDPIISPAAAIRLKNVIRQMRTASLAISTSSTTPGTPSSSATPTSSKASNKNNLITEQSKSNIKRNILTALSLCRATPIESILSECLHWLIISEFPSKWTDLLPNVSTYLQSNQDTKIHAALIVLRKLCKSYEFKTRDVKRLSPTDLNDVGLLHPRQPLEHIAQLCFPTLLNLYRHLDCIVANLNQVSQVERDHASRAQRLIVKIFWSCTHFILPPCLAEANALHDWMTALLTTLKRPCKYVDVDEQEEINQIPEWKTKKWIASILNRFLKRYGSPKKIPVDEPWAITISQQFKSTFAESATSVMLHVLISSTPSIHDISNSSTNTNTNTNSNTNNTNTNNNNQRHNNSNDETDKHDEQNQPKQLSRRVAHLALDYLEEAIETAQLWSIIKPHIDTLLTKVVFSYLTFSEEDEELWETDPGEYVRKQYDFTEDLTSPRMAASNLLTKMGDLRSKSTIIPFLQYLITMICEPFTTLNQQQNHEQHKQLAKLKVGVFVSLAAVKMRLVSKKEYSNSFVSVIKQYVVPDLQSNYGFLRSESAWLLGQIASCNWSKFDTQFGQNVLRNCVNLLEDEFIPVQASAAGALQFLMDQDSSTCSSSGNKNGKSLIEPVAPQLLDRLLQLMDRMNEGYGSLLPAIDKLVERYPQKIIPFLVPLIQRLINAFKQSAEGILKDGDDEDDELVFTAAQVLHLISSVLACVGEWQQQQQDDDQQKSNKEKLKEERGKVLMLLERELESLLTFTFEESHQVFVEEFLDILGILIVQIGEINNRLSPFLISLIPKMAKGFHEWAVDYIEQMMDAIEGYITFGMIDLCHSVISKEVLIQFQHLNQSHHLQRDNINLLKGNRVIYCLIGMIDKLWSEKIDDLNDADFGTKIAQWIILNLSKSKLQHPTFIEDSLYHDIILNIASSAGQRLSRCLRNSNNNDVGKINGNNNDNNNVNSSDDDDDDESEKLRRLRLTERLFCVLMDCCYVNAEIVLKQLGVEWMMQLIGRFLNEIDGDTGSGTSLKFETVYSKKSLILGLCGIICTRGLIMEESKPHLLRIIMNIQQKLEKQKKDSLENKHDVIEVQGSDILKLNHTNKSNNISSSSSSVTPLSSLSPFVDMNHLKDKSTDANTNGNIISGVGNNNNDDNDGGSDLDDDEDASILVEDIISERQHQLALERIINRNGSGNLTSTIGLNGEDMIGLTNGLLGDSNKKDDGQALDYLDFLEREHDEDEMLSVGVHVLDEIDEVDYLVKCLKIAVGDGEGWWKAASNHDKVILENLARRIDVQQRQLQQQQQQQQQQGMNSSFHG